jgi:hypothetical protein
MSRRLMPALSLIALSGCGGAVAAGQHASMYGQNDVTFAGDFSALGTLQTVTVGPNRAYNLRPSATGVTVTLQGSPTPGAVDVQLTGSSGTKTLPKAIVYDPAPANVPLKWVSFGASLTQSFMSNGVDTNSQLNGFSAQLAKAEGVFIGLPLFTATFAPQQQPTDFYPNCNPRPGTGVNPQDFVKAITDADGNIDLQLARIDPTLVAQDLAVGGSNIDEILNGGKVVQALLEHIVDAPNSPGTEAFDTLPYSQIGRIEQLDPDIGVSADLLANDMRPDLIATPEKARPILDGIMQRLGKLHGQFFIANMPTLSFVPGVTDIRSYRLARHLDTAATFDAKIKQIDDATQALNVELVAAMQPYPNLHVVDFYGRVEAIKVTGVAIGGEVLRPVRFGGLLSLDDLHFTATGYAMVANVFVDAINAALHANVAPIDLAVVHAADPLSAAKLHAAGLKCAPTP